MFESQSSAKPAAETRFVMLVATIIYLLLKFKIVNSAAPAAEMLFLTFASQHHFFDTKFQNYLDTITSSIPKSKMQFRSRSNLEFSNLIATIIYLIQNAKFETRPLQRANFSFC